jgi:hypothetical protein
VARRLFVLLLDMVASAKLADRDSATRSFARASRRANLAHAHELFAPLQVTRGDEAAAVLSSVRQLYDLMAALSEEMHPVRLRYVLVLGELTAGLQTRRSGVIDGPAFYRADETMRRLKRSQKTFALSTGRPDLDEPAEALVNLLQWRWSDMTPLQRKIVRLYQREGTQADVGRRLRRTQQQVSNALRATRWELLDAAEAAARGLFERIDAAAATTAPTQRSGGSSGEGREGRS